MTEGRESEEEMSTKSLNIDSPSESEHAVI
jgi:hypothetical protein